MKSRLVSETNMTPCLLFISCLAHVRRNRTFIFNHSVIYSCFCKDSRFTLQRHTTSKHVFKFTCVTTLVVWVSDCCWNSDDRHSVLCLNASCVNPDRQTAGRPATDQNRLCYTLWHERTEEDKTLWSGSTGALRDKQRNVYSGLFSNSDPTRFLFLKVFFFFARIFWLEYLLSRVKLCLIFPLLWNWQGKCVKLSEKHLHEKRFLVLSV